jgi:hypothetical protein
MPARTIYIRDDLWDAAKDITKIESPSKLVQFALLEIVRAENQKKMQSSLNRTNQEK